MGDVCVCVCVWSTYRRCIQLSSTCESPDGMDFQTFQCQRILRNFFSHDTSWWQFLLHSSPNTLQSHTVRQSQLSNKTMRIQNLLLTLFGYSLGLGTLYALVFRPSVASAENSYSGIRVAFQLYAIILASHLAAEYIWNTRIINVRLFIIRGHISYQILFYWGRNFNALNN